MADFEVRYNIQVISEPAVAAITKLQGAAKGLQQVHRQFSKLNTSVNNLNQRLKAMQSKTYVVKIDTTKAEAALNRLLTQANAVKAALAGASSGVAKTAIAGSKGAAKTTSAASKRATASGGSGAAPATAIPVSASSRSAAKTSFARARTSSGTFLPPAYAGVPTAPVTPVLPQMPGKPTASRTTRAASTSVQSRAIKPKGVSNIGYRVLGPAMIDSGGIGALSMLKGMGIMYGITGLGAAMGNAVSDYVDYNNIMTTTRGILESHDNRENFAGRFKGMERIARNIGRRTKFTAPEVAGATKFLAMAGFNIEDINRSMPTIANMALVADTDIGRTADLVTNILTAYRMPTNKITNMADVMTMGFTMSNTTLEEMAESYKYFASIGSAHDLDFKELTAMIGLLGDAGIKGSSAGTAIRQIMSNMLKQSKPQKETWKALGINPVGEDGKLRSMMDVFGELAAKNATLKAFNLFRVTAAQGATSLIQDQAAIQKWQKMYEEMQHADGITEKLATNRIENLEGKWMQIKSTFEDVAMTVMESLTPEAEMMMQRLLGWLNSPQAAQTIGDITRGLFDLATAIGDITASFIQLYRHFGPVINWWLKWQLILSAILVPLRTIKALFFGGLGLITLAGKVGGLTSSFGALLSSITNARWRTAWGQMRNGFMSMATGASVAASAANGAMSANTTASRYALANGALARGTVTRPGFIGAAPLTVNGWQGTLQAYSRLRLSPAQQNVLATQQWALASATQQLGQYAYSTKSTSGYQKALVPVNAARTQMHKAIAQMMPTHMAKIDAVNARIQDYRNLQQSIQNNSNQLSKLRGRQNTWQQQSRLQAEIRRQQAQLANMATPAALQRQLARLQSQTPLVAQQQAHAHALAKNWANYRIANAPNYAKPTPVTPQQLLGGVAYANGNPNVLYKPTPQQQPPKLNWWQRMNARGESLAKLMERHQTITGFGSMALGYAGGTIGYKAGGGMGAILGSIAGMAMPAMIGAGPIGWVGAAAVGITGLLLSLSTAARDAKQAMDNLKASFASGVIYENGFMKGNVSDVMKHYQLVYDGNLATNDLVRLRLEMLHSIHDEETAIAEEQMRRAAEEQRKSNAENALSSLNDTITWYQNLLGDNTAASARIIEAYEAMMPGQKFWSMGANGINSYIDYTGVSHTMPGDINKDNARVAYALAASAISDQAHRSTLDKYQKEFTELSAIGNRAEMWAYYNKIKLERDSQLKNIASNLMPENFTYEDLSQLSAKDMASSFFARDIWARQLDPIVKMMEHKITSLDQWEAAVNSGKITENDIKAYAFAYNKPLYSLESFNTDSWYKQIGYDVQKKNFVDWHGTDVFGNSKSASAYEMASSFIEEYKRMIEIFKLLPLTAQPAANNILGKYQIIANQAEEFIKKSGATPIANATSATGAYASNYKLQPNSAPVTTNNFNTPMNITINGRLLDSEKSEILAAVGTAIDNRIRQAASTVGASNLTLVPRV